MDDIHNMDQNNLIEEAYHCVTSLRSITETIQDTLNTEDYGTCVVKLIQRQEYIRKLVLLGTHPLLSAQETENQGVSIWLDEDTRIQTIKEDLHHIRGLDRVYEEQLHSIKQTLVQRMQEMTNARRFIKNYRRAHPSASRFVDLIES